MSFALAVIEYKSSIIFYSLIFLVVYLNRNKFDVHGKFVYLYRTKIGIKFMNLVSDRARGLVKFMGYAAIAVGFLGMIFVSVAILSLTYNLILDRPGAGGASPVIPGLPIAGTGLVFPLITGWVVLFIIILVHEFSHGIVASAHKIKVKHSGMAFFGPILGAFVEPDEKELEKQKDRVKYSVFAAGSFSNFLTVVLVLLATSAILNPAIGLLSASTGVVVFSQPGLPAEKAGIENNTIVTEINGQPVNTLEGFQEIIKGIAPWEKVNIKSEEQNYAIITTESPEDPSQGYLGVWIIGENRELRNNNTLNKALFGIVKWLEQMFGWLAFLSLNIGLINLFPVFITDGARMLKVFFERVIPTKGKSMSVWLFINWLFMFSLAVLVFLPFFRWLGSIFALY
ncbi:site-2 protease family protein [Candidatus Woesearchaeota archaeon]|nr:site-2 protease family protein [Candidatus Woesearchaeota archaeon]